MFIRRFFLTQSKLQDKKNQREGKRWRHIVLSRFDCTALFIIECIMRSGWDFRTSRDMTLKLPPNTKAIAPDDTEQAKPSNDDVVNSPGKILNIQVIVWKTKVMVLRTREVSAVLFALFIPISYRGILQNAKKTTNPMQNVQCKSRRVRKNLSTHDYVTRASDQKEDVPVRLSQFSLVVIAPLRLYFCIFLTFVSNVYASLCFDLHRIEKPVELF